MRYAFSFIFFCMLSFNLQAQTPLPPNDLVMGELVPDYLRQAILSGKAKVHGVQAISDVPEIIPVRKFHLRKRTSRLEQHPETVVYLQQRIMGNPDLEDGFLPPPSIVKSLFGIRGASMGGGGLTVEQATIGSTPLE